MTERTFVSQTAGPVVFGLELPMGSVHVQVLDSIKAATVVLRTEDSSGPAAEAIHQARAGQDGQAMSVEVPRLPDNTVMQSVHGNRVTQSATTVHGNVTGITIINGRIIAGGSTTPAVSPIVARVFLPAGSCLAVVSQSASTRVHGEVERMEFRSVSGDLDVSAARRLNATTTSGDLLIGRLVEQLTARTVSGDITIDRYAGTEADLTTTSGDVRVYATATASGTLRATTVSGDVKVSGAHDVRVQARSVSGRVRTH
ncbi:DUF4097 domain-containing protein [Streptomyces sp. SID13666]|uniref:DUF4097 family beta strand repeat-containing protein n=1 Tax=unclassified Streptomyces TaxID=2593676 RepID=UPI0013C24EDA|nr:MULTISPECIES: DUF4097 family beta strand repeat-containing protein [unclassified Streptomyces]NEA57973.1 DUF4097 domain-containing protein [Streptomyces sp. SID13666]NEA72831.1 DUF4097 domain-containing protein [Streptomyces sp. SID13588]